MAGNRPVPCPACGGTHTKVLETEELSRVDDLRMVRLLARHVESAAAEGTAEVKGKVREQLLVCYDCTGADGLPARFLVTYLPPICQPTPLRYLRSDSRYRN